MTDTILDLVPLIRSGDFAKLRNELVQQRPQELASAFCDLRSEDQVLAFRIRLRSNPCWTPLEANIRGRDQPEHNHGEVSGCETHQAIGPRECRPVSRHRRQSRIRDRVALNGFHRTCVLRPLVWHRVIAWRSTKGLSES
jgi:hypothetical protein